MTVFIKRIVLIILCCCFLNCEDSDSENGSIYNFVPKSASIVIKFSTDVNPSSSFSNFNNAIKDNELLSSFVAQKSHDDLWKKMEVLKNMNSKGAVLLCISNENDSIDGYTFITKATSKILNTDSINKATIDTILIGKNTVQRISFSNQVLYTASRDSVFIASSSEQFMAAVLAGKTEKNAAFKKLLQLTTESDFSVVTKGAKLQNVDSAGVNFTSWTNIDIAVLRDGISATGVSIARDTIPQLLSIFKGQIPQQNNIASIVPSDALKVLSFTFSDAEALQLNLNKLNNKTTNENTADIFGTVSEIGEVLFVGEKAVILNSIDPVLTREALGRYISKKNNFRQIAISSFSAPQLFEEAFAPLISNTKPTLLFQLDNFFVFTESEANAKQIITAYTNKNCLGDTSYFQKHASQLSSASSLLFLNLQGEVPTSLSGFLDFTTGGEKEIIRSKKYPLAALQYSYDRDFAHVNFVSRESSSKKQVSGRVSQDFNLKLTNELLGRPVFFNNHRSKLKDILVQDITNAIHLINPDGKTIWTEKIDGPLLGEINDVDIYRNGKRQMAFKTKNTLNVLDRNGKNIAPFPIKFKDPITQPLAVFDYDKNRKYRFLVTQGKDVYMYVSGGKAVTGFTFKKASSKIVLPPQHLQLGTKDYIAIAEENGTLNLLSRRGKPRIELTKKFAFSEIPIAKEGSKFVVITKDNKKESISQNGKVKSISLDVSANYNFSVTGTTKVTLDDNLLRIKGKLVELPFGIYTKPKLFFANRSIYVSVTETQDNKVYLYKSSGSLVKGFPVFGSSLASVSEGTKRGSLKIVVKGENNEVICYGLR